MKKFKWIGLLLCLAMLITALVGCGGQETGKVAEEDPNTVPEDTYEINWYTMGKAMPDIAEVEAAINDYLKDKINATVKITRMESGQYQQQLNTMMATGEYFDCCFVAEWCLEYFTAARNGGFLALDEYLDTYMPKTKALMAEDIWDNVRVDGSIYGVPTNKEFAQQVGWSYRKDLAEKYNLDMSQYKSIDELEPVLKMIKENEPGFDYPIDWGTDRTPQALVGTTKVGTTELALFNDLEKYGPKVVQVSETEEYMEACRAARRFYEAGLIKPDILTASDFSQRLKDGKIFAYIEFLKPGKAQEVCQKFNYQLEQTPVTQIVQQTGAGAGSMIGISRTSKNPARVARFLELVNTDKYLNNLINFGIEGKHYTKISDDMIKITPNAGYTLSGETWMTGNVFLNYLVEGEDENKLKDLAEFNKDAVKPWYYGFIFDPLPVEQEVAAVANVNGEYKKQMTLGAMDPDAIYDEYRAKLKAAGIDKIQEEAQRQLDEFMASKNQ